ncbi:hypothetical protein BDE02_12G003500 [Populus trichocarpa]|nr:hypothetical protein BDE02_12G003500 [Populus trichocarpa]
MGASTNRSSSFNNVKINFDSSPHLDLSLRRSHPMGLRFEIQKKDGLSGILMPQPLHSTLTGLYSFHIQHWKNRLGQHTNDSTNGSLQKQEDRLDSLEDRGLISPATDQSASSSFCNGAASHFNSMGDASESKNEEGAFTHSYSHRSIQREAALTKFRLKRKERCYEKKVRYESRKKLAEQRPRVKGQFVRQVHTDPSPAETDQ